MNRITNIINAIIKEGEFMEEVIEHVPGFESLSDADCVQSLRARMHGVTFAAYGIGLTDEHPVGWFRDRADEAMKEIVARGGSVIIQDHHQNNSDVKAVHIKCGDVRKSFVL
jgi:hypothetical protein